MAPSGGGVAGAEPGSEYFHMIHGPPLPPFDADDALRLAREHFGLEGRVSPLPGDRDRNVRLRTSEGKDFVVKIAQGDEDPAVLKAQGRVMARVARSTGLAPTPMVSLHGEDLPTIEGPDGRSYRIRVVPFLEGPLLADIPQRSEPLLESVGEALGRLDRALMDVDEPELHREFDWDLLRGMEVARTHLDQVGDGELRGHVQSVLERVQGAVGTTLEGLPRGILHNDANDHNIILHRERPEVRGFIDFGDAVHSIRVAEPAIAMAYACLDQPDPLESCAALLRGYVRQVPLSEEELEAVFPLVLLRLGVSVVMASVQGASRPDDPYLRVSQGPIRRTLPFLLSLPTELARSTMRRAAGHSVGAWARPPDFHDPSAARTLRRDHLVGSLSLSYEAPVTLRRGWMQFLWDHEGRRYLDAYNNVPHVGHAHPRVVEAACRQMALLNTNTRYLTGLVEEYAARLAATLPEPLSVCAFVNSASEANELALRLVRAATGRRDLIVLEAGYHGHTTSMIDASPYKHKGPGGAGPPDWVHTAPLPDPYRGIHRREVEGTKDGSLGTAYAEEVRRIVAELVDEGRPPAGFLAETFPSVGGQIEPPEGFFTGAYEAVRAAGGLCIADEVQTGYGRIGSQMYAFQREGVVPDIVVLGKPMGNGHPIGAVVTTPEVARAFDTGMEFFSTFGGNTVSCAVGMAVLDVLEDEGLQRHALEVGDLVRRGLRELMAHHPLIGDVRGSGFFLGVELVEDRETRAPAGVEAVLVAEGMRREGILLGTDGSSNNVLKIRPPMPFSQGDAHQLLRALDRVLGSVSGGDPSRLF
jgi:4-aminobutyrate aminotransferase-like enzyme/Ser/Thr protein kinase RdoA (MazF antagonist)